jgi:hypothetical protein
MSMRKLVLVCLVISNIFSVIQANQNNCHSSKTFFMPRAIIEDVIFTLNNTNYYNYYQKEGDTCYGFSFSAQPFFQRSVKRHKLARYFLPCHAPRSLVVAQDGTGDIGSLWLGLEAAPGQNFRSIISICPRRTIEGAVFAIRQDINCAYVDLNLAYVQAKHDMQLTECCPTGTILNAPTSCVGVLNNITNATSAFNNPALQFGKISCRELKDRRLDDIEVKLGYNFKQDSCGHFSLYGAGLISTEHKPCGDYLFEPIIGRAGHHAIGAGLSAGSIIYNCDGQTIIALLTNFDYRFFLKSNECRTLDLCNGDWSRFLLVARDATTNLPFPAVNYLTRPFKVEPRSMINWWTALHWEHRQVHIELGYNLWWKDAEKLCLINSCNNNSTGIFDLTGSLTGSPISASRANITQSNTGSNAAPSDTQFTPITNAQLHINSAKMPSVLTNKVYGTLGLSFPTCASPVELALGGAYEFSRSNAALEQWAVWLKLIIGY